jgi:hypothetical protein
MTRILLAIVGVLAACGNGPEPAKPVPQSPAAIAAAAPAITALQTSKFDDARQIASQVLQQDGGNSRAAAVRALVTYQAAGTALIRELSEIMDRGAQLKAFDHEGGRTTWQDFLAALEAVDRDLTIAGADPAFSLELCLACWQHDWNRSGHIDDRDRKLFEIEYDAKGEPIDQADPARRPTFRFDAGDIEWARAMISFQRAGVEMILAYRWSELDKLFAFSLFGSNKKLAPITIRLIDPGRMKHARTLILAGVDHADKCRVAYLAETDDDREWVPNPTQQSHPIPLPMDAAIYATWEGVTGDVRRMLTSEDGLSLRQFVGMFDAKAAVHVPDAYLDFGAMLREPKDIVIDLSDESKSPQNIERVLRGIFGNGYRSAMKPSPAVERLSRMKDELERGGDTVENKLRYLLWLN